MAKTKKLRIEMILVTLICLLSIIFACLFLIKTRNQTILKQLKNYGEMTVAAIDPGNLKAVSENYSDKSQDFSRIRTQLLGLENQFNSAGVDSFYTMSKKGNEIIFLVGSVPYNDPMYGPPGYKYLDPPAELQQVFASGLPAFVGPYTDEYGTFYSYFTPVKGDDGSIIGVVGVDVTLNYYQKMLSWRLAILILIIFIIYILSVLLLIFTNRLSRSEKDLLDKEKIAEDMINVLPDIFYLLDQDGKLLLSNKALSAAFNIDKKNLAMTVFTDLLKGADKKIIVDSLKRARAAGHDAVEMEIKNNGTAKLYEFNHALLKTPQGDIIGIAGGGHDISQSHDREINLDNQKKELENMNHLMIGREAKMMELKKEIARLQDVLKKENKQS